MTTPAARSMEIYMLAYYLSELTWRVQDMEGRMSANSDAIEAVVADLQAYQTRVTDKIAALEAANAAGEDLTAPLADLKNEAASLDASVPAAPAEAPAPGVAAPDAGPAGTVSPATPTAPATVADSPVVPADAATTTSDVTPEPPATS